MNMTHSCHINCMLSLGGMFLMAAMTTVSIFSHYPKTEVTLNEI